jgi:hypothetical protein
VTLETNELLSSQMTSHRLSFCNGLIIALLLQGLIHRRGPALFRFTMQHPRLSPVGATNLRLGLIFEEDLATRGALTASSYYSLMIGHAEMKCSFGGRKPLICIVAHERPGERIHR